MPPRSTPELYVDGRPTPEAVERARQMRDAVIGTKTLLPPEAADILFLAAQDESFVPTESNTNY